MATAAVEVGVAAAGHTVRMSISRWLRIRRVAHAGHQCSYFAFEAVKNIAESRMASRDREGETERRRETERQRETHSHRHRHVLVPINEQLQFKLDRSVGNLERWFYATASLSQSPSLSQSLSQLALWYFGQM